MTDRHSIPATGRAPDDSVCPPAEGEPVNSGVAPQASAARRRITKNVLFAGVTVAAFFAVVEGLLALFGVRPVVETDDPFIGFASSIPLYVEQTRPDGSVVLTTARNKLAYFNDQRFPKTKHEGAYRIFCLGGSTTYGRPFDDTTSFAGWLRELLPLADRSRLWEVVNAGGISYASYRVAALMQELVAREPDLFIVYTGQNEFLERRTYGKLADSPRVVGLSAILGRTRLYAAMSSLMNTTGDRFGRPRPGVAILPGEVDAILDRSVGPADYQRDDSLKTHVLAHFQHNLGRMVDIARSAGAEILFVTPASNLKDCTPFKSEPTAGLSPLTRTRSDAALRRAAELLAGGRHREAWTTIRPALQDDSRNAGAWYTGGRILLELKRYDEAAEAFRRARDEDVCPLRAVTEIPRIVARTAAEYGVPIVDFEAIVEDACRNDQGHAIPGNEYFLDHVHPNIETTRLLAAAIVDALVEQRVVRPEDGVWNEAVVDAAAQRIHRRVDPRLQAVSLRNLAKVLSWAGKQEEAARLARESLRLLPNDPESLFITAIDLHRQGKRDEALEACRRALPYLPNSIRLHRLLAQLLVENGEYERARAYLNEALRIAPDDADLHATLAVVLLQLKQPDEAVAHCRRAVELKPSDAGLHHNLGTAWAQAGELDRALTHFREAVRHDPHDAEALNSVGLLLVQTDRLDEAIEHYEKSLALRPDYQEARRNLAVARRMRTPGEASGAAEE